MTTTTDAVSHDGTVTDALQRITDAASDLRIAKALIHPDAIATAQDDLHGAVLAANDLGFSWQRIGEVLDIARGNAYKRYRRKA